MATEHGYFAKDRQKKVGNVLIHGIFFRFENPHLWKFFENLCAMWRTSDLLSQLRSRLVPPHVKSWLPQFAFRNIVDFALVGDVYRLSIFAIELGQFLAGKFSQLVLHMLSPSHQD